MLVLCPRMCSMPPSIMLNMMIIITEMIILHVLRQGVMKNNLSRLTNTILEKIEKASLAEMSVAPEEAMRDAHLLITRLRERAHPKSSKLSYADPLYFSIGELISFA